MIRVAAIVGAIMLALLAYQTHRANKATKQLARAEMALEQIRTTLDTERNDRRIADATIDQLNKDLDGLRNQPPIVGVRCRTVRLPAEGGSASPTDAATASTGQGLSAGDSGGGQSFGPEIDVSAGLDWYASRCSEQAVTQASLQAFEAQRTH